MSRRAPASAAARAPEAAPDLGPSVTVYGHGRVGAETPAWQPVRTADGVGRERVVTPREVDQSPRMGRNRRPGKELLLFG